MTARAVFPPTGPGPALGVFVKSPDPDLARAAGAADIDFAVVDLEHSMLDLPQVAELLAVLDDAGVAPLVRLGRPDPVLTAKVLEAGAAGIQLSNTSSIHDVRAARSASAFPPRGERGVSFAHRGADWGLMPAAEYVAEDRDGAVIIQLETATTESPLTELLAERPDAVFIGLEDLRVSCAAAGVDFEGRVAELIAAITSAGLPWGCPSAPERAKDWIARGATFVTIGADRAVYATALAARRATALGPHL